MPYALSTESMDFVADLFQRRVNNVFLSDISQHSNNGIEFCCGVFYAEYLGLRIIGRIDSWVMRLRRSPLSVDSQLLDGVRRLLALKNLHLSDDGVLSIGHQGNWL